MAILKRMGNILVAGAAVGAVITLGATSAFAAGKATTWSITPGGNTSETSGTVTLTDTTNGNSLTCTSAAIKGSFKSGHGLAGAKAGAIKSIAFNGCAISGFSVTVHASNLPWHVNLKKYVASTGTTTGTITGIKASLSTTGCSGSVGGTTSTNSGSIAFSYVNSTHTLSIPTTGSTLHAWNVSCFGVVNTGDALSISTSAPVSPAQTITSP